MRNGIVRAIVVCLVMAGALAVTQQASMAAKPKASLRAAASDLRSYTDAPVALRWTVKHAPRHSKVFVYVVRGKNLDLVKRSKKLTTSHLAVGRRPAGITTYRLVVQSNAHRVLATKTLTVPVYARLSMATLMKKNTTDFWPSSGTAQVGYPFVYNVSIPSMAAASWGSNVLRIEDTSCDGISVGLAGSGASGETDWGFMISTGDRYQGVSPGSGYSTPLVLHGDVGLTVHVVSPSDESTLYGNIYADCLTKTGHF